MAFAFARKDLSLAHLRYVLVLLALMGLDLTFPREASAVTVRSNPLASAIVSVRANLVPMLVLWMLVGLQTGRIVRL